MWSQAFTDSRLLGRTFLILILTIVTDSPLMAGPIVPADEADAGKGKNLTASCPVSGSAPWVQRRSIVIKDGHFGEGTMEVFPGVAILRLYGTPYEMGYQHGAMLKDEINRDIEEKREQLELNPLVFDLAGIYSMIRHINNWPKWAEDELRGMADGSGIRRSHLVWLNMTGAEKSDGKEDRQSKAVKETATGTIIPSWLLVIYHPESGGKIMAVTRPGRVGIMAGMDEKGCCVKGEISGNGMEPDGISLRESLLADRCGEDNDNKKEGCGLEIMERPGAVEVYFHENLGLSCISRDRGALWTAVDLESESFHEGCGPCGKDG